MPIEIPDKFKRLFSREVRAFAALALVLEDGTPQVTVVWFDWDGTDIIINTARGRVKDKVLHKRPVVALAIFDPDDLYHFVQLRGPVVDETEQGAYDMICSLNEKYHGKYEYPKKPGEVRVTYKVRPDHISVH